MIRKRVILTPALHLERPLRIYPNLGFVPIAVLAKSFLKNKADVQEALWSLTAADKCAASARIGKANGNGPPERPSSNHRPEVYADSCKNQSPLTAAAINGRNGMINVLTLLKLPKMGWIGMPRCRNKLWLQQWCKSNGAEIESGEVVALVDTPHGNIKIKAPASGFLFWMKKDRHKVHLPDVLGIIIDQL